MFSTRFLVKKVRWGSQAFTTGIILEEWWDSAKSADYVGIRSYAYAGVDRESNKCRVLICIVSGTVLVAEA